MQEYFHFPCIKAVHTKTCIQYNSRSVLDNRLHFGEELSDGFAERTMREVIRKAATFNLKPTEESFPELPNVLVRNTCERSLCVWVWFVFLCACIWTLPCSWTSSIW